MTVTVQAYQQAERDLAATEGRRGWQIHVALYVAALSAMIALNLTVIAFTSGDFVWFPFPLVGWGIGVTLHYLYCVRWVDHELRARQTHIEDQAERALQGVGAPGADRS